MEGIYERHFDIPAWAADCCGRLKLSHLLHLVQEAAGDHSRLLGAGREDLEKKGIFWAVIRHRVQISRLPASGESITVTTWPMPTTRTAYPRAAAAFDREGRLLFQSVSLWALMDTKTRALVLPRSSGVAVEGIIRGGELALPGAPQSLAAGEQEKRTVRFTELDVNGHMNNCRYLDWVADALPPEFCRRCPREFSVCYFSEAREAEQLQLRQAGDSEMLALEIGREEGAVSAGHSRVFAAQLRYE